ncbi:MAG: hypothetical protein EON49_03095 [Acidovorax sp.]|nr:MAG: hypothetical protein EON49_03095 [Acidovorax sp.]
MAVDGTSMEEGWLGALADWLSARTTLVLVLLMVQLGLLVALWPLFSRPTLQPTTASRGARVACGEFEVVFTQHADFASLRKWALNFDAQIVAGPNARGAFELSVPQVDIDALRQVLGPLAEQVRTNPLCNAEKPT